METMTSVHNESNVNSLSYSTRINNSITSIENTSKHTDNKATNTQKTLTSKFITYYNNHQLLFVILGAILGIALGIALTQWNPSNPSSKTTALLWIGLLGQLFIRALRCIILPLIFSSIAISVMDMLALGKAGRVVGHTVGLYLFTTVCAAGIGVLSSFAFSGMYGTSAELDGDVEQIVPEVRFSCGIGYLTEMDDGSIVCSAGNATTESLFLMEDVNGYYAVSAEARGRHELTMSESFYHGLFMKMVGPNMVGLFTDNNFLGVIVLAAAFGVALSNLAENPPTRVKWTQILTIQILEEIMNICMMFVHWIIKSTPICILSLVATAIGSQSEMGQVMATIGWLFVSFLAGICTQFFIIYCTLYYFYQRSNPFKYFRHIIKAMTLAFACSSSAATLPVTLDCVKKTGKVPQGVANFVLPLGATVNMDGFAIWLITSCIALAYLNGITPTVANYVVLAFSSTLGTIGAAPVPSGGMVLTLACYESTFGAIEGGGIPYGFGLLLAINWLADRFVTVCNVTGDTVVAALVSADIVDDSEMEMETKSCRGLEVHPESAV